MALQLKYPGVEHIFCDGVEYTVSECNCTRQQAFRYQNPTIGVLCLRGITEVTSTLQDQSACDVMSLMLVVE